MALLSRTATEDAVAVATAETATGVADDPVKLPMTEFAASVAMFPSVTTLEPNVEFQVPDVTVPVAVMVDWYGSVVTEETTPDAADKSPVKPVGKVTVPVKLGEAIVGLDVSTTLPVPDDVNQTGAAAEPVPSDCKKYGVVVALPAKRVGVPEAPP